jgi:uncharacterized protein
MDVALHKRFTVTAPADAVWGAVRDLTCVVSCVPGATLDEGRQTGTLTVCIGPATLHFAGPIECWEPDDAERRVRLLCAARDSLRSSHAQLDLLTTVSRTGNEASQVVGEAQLTVTGALAGLGERVVLGVAEQVMDGFAVNLTGRVMGRPAAAGAARGGAALDGAEIVFGAIGQGLKRLLGGRRAR